MSSKITSALIAICAIAAILMFWINHRSAGAAGALPSGHEIKCFKADGQTPCGEADVTGLNDDLAGLKKKLVQTAKTVAGDAKGVVGDVQGAVGDVKQVAQDGKQVRSDAKQLAKDAKNKDLKQGVTDAKQAAGDAKTAGGDAKNAAGDPKQVGGDAKQMEKDLQGVGGVSLKSSDGTMNCTQNDGKPCSDTQTKALQAHAAAKTPPIKVQRQADQTSN